MDLFGAWECGPVPWDFAAFVRFWFSSTRGYLVVVSSLSLDWKDWGKKTPRPDACIVDRPCSQCSSPHVRSTGTSSLRSEHPVYGLGMIGVIIAPLVLPIEAVAIKIP